MSMGAGAATPRPRDVGSTVAPAAEAPKRYRTIVVDPPWTIPFGSARTYSGKGFDTAKYPVVAELPYPTMTLDAIAALPLADLAEPDAHLYIWTVNRYIAQTYALVAGWGFRPAQLLTWCKAPMGLGLGGAFTPTTEHVLFCRRGTLTATARMDSTWWQWKRGEHSAKPEAFMDIVEQVSPGPYLEMFSRRARLGWQTWGDEALHGGAHTPALVGGNAEQQHGTAVPAKDAARAHAAGPATPTPPRPQGVAGHPTIEWVDEADNDWGGHPPARESRK